jgi:hypothetical protein
MLKAKSFIVVLVAVFVAVMVSAVTATSAKAAADPSVTITAAPNPVLIGNTTTISGTAYSTAPLNPDVFESTIYSGAGCVAGNAIAPGPPLSITWESDLVNGTWSYTSPKLFGLGGYSFGIYYEDDSGYYGGPGIASACVDVAVVTSLPSPQADDDEATEAPDNEAVENETWACYSHFQDAPVAITVSQFNFLTKAPQPELGGKPYWSNGFIPFANQTAAMGQAIGNGYYLHCNLAGPPVVPNVWVNSDGMPLGGNHYADWVAEFGAGATDPAGNPAAFNFYPVVAN